MKASFSIQASRSGIKEVRLGADKRHRSRARQSRPDDALARRWQELATKELSAYLAGRLRSFSAPCDLSGLPAFTRAVLKITVRIPYGQVRSYRWIAGLLGKPGASRAVGNALARNPIPIVIPCHRVVQSDGGLGGYALGMNWKRRLLDLEKSRSGRAAAK
ncbi:MAG: MGMT family protein [Deltaproteobacteria bacterium]|nr:MGMT family protein [Deltaproteobacteria bacterium]